MIAINTRSNQYSSQIDRKIGPKFDGSLLRLTAEQISRVKCSAMHGILRFMLRSYTPLDTVLVNEACYIHFL